MRQGRGGFTLVEVVVSGALLVLFSLMAAQGFSACGRLMQRSSRFREAEVLAENRIARKERPSRTENVTLDIGDGRTWEVDVETYEQQLGDADISYKVLRDRRNEE